tara:strand:- start:62 stop:493 length:432 start_codon:yes stop_codon:yes gene_type:complete
MTNKNTITIEINTESLFSDEKKQDILFNAIEKRLTDSDWIIEQLEQKIRDRLIDSEVVKNINLRVTKYLESNGDKRIEEYFRYNYSMQDSINEALKLNQDTIQKQVQNYLINNNAPEEVAKMVKESLTKVINDRLNLTPYDED